MNNPHRRIQKEHAFVHMLKRLKEKHGSVTRCCKAAGISEHAYYRAVSDGEVVQVVARKIAAAFKAEILTPGANQNEQN